MKGKKPIHLLIRFSDNLLKTGDTITAHQEVIQQHSAVWFAKLGSPIAQVKIDTVNKQIGEGISTYVFLVKGNRRKSIVYRSNLMHASRSLPDGESISVPPYYYEYDVIKYARFWAKLAKIERIQFSDLQKLKVEGSVLPIQETLFKSSSGHFYLIESTV